MEGASSGGCKHQLFSTFQRSPYKVTLQGHLTRLAKQPGGGEYPHTLLDGMCRGAVYTFYGFNHGTGYNELL